MKLTKLSLTNYGPVNTEYEFADGFNLLFGPNEQGKSLTLDAMVKLLLGKGSKKLPKINRVDTDPATFGGYISLELQDKQQKKEYQLQGKPNLSEYIDLNAEECMNLFVIRNSDLSIGQSDQEQDNFYTSLTDRLTGLKTEEIKQTVQTLRDYSQLTDTNKFQDIQERHHLASRIKDAKKILSEEGIIGSIQKDNNQHHWEQMEAEYWQLKREIKQRQKTLTQLESAAKIENYQQLKNALEKAKKDEKLLTNLKSVTQDKLLDIKLAKQALETAKANYQELKKAVKKQQDKLEDLEQKYQTSTEQLERDRSNVQEVEQLLQSKLPILMDQKSQITADKNQFQIWSGLLLLFSLLLILSLATLLFQSLQILFVPIVLFSVCSAYSFYKILSHKQHQQHFDAGYNRLQLDLQKLKVPHKELAKIAQDLNQYRQDFQALQAKNSSLNSQRKATRDDLAELRDKKMDESRRQVAKQQETIKNAFEKCQVNSIRELQVKLVEKQKIETGLQKHLTLLESRLGKPSSNQGQIRYSQTQQSTTQYYQRKLSAQAHLDKAQAQLKYDPQQEQLIKKEQQQAQEKMETVTSQLSTLRNKLNELQKEANKVLVDRDEPILCENIADLSQLEKELKQFVTHHQQQRKNTVEVLDILAEIEQEEKEKVAKLFGEDTQITKQFASITNHNYQQVYYDQETHHIKVQAADGKQYTPNKLSAGTFDQLFFSIRVGLGKKLLHNQTGFFIMDDPFIKADLQRLHQQLKMLLELANQGWQIIYFSAKEEVRSFLLDQQDQQLNQQLRRQPVNFIEV